MFLKSRRALLSGNCPPWYQIMPRPLPSLTVREKWFNKTKCMFRMTTARWLRLTVNFKIQHQRRFKSFTQNGRPNLNESIFNIILYEHVMLLINWIIIFFFDKLDTLRSFRLTVVFVNNNYLLSHFFFPSILPPSTLIFIFQEKSSLPLL